MDKLDDVKGLQAVDLLNSDVVKAFFSEKKELCYSKFENWDGKTVNTLVEAAIEARMAKELELHLETAAAVFKRNQLKD